MFAYVSVGVSERYFGKGLWWDVNLRGFGLRGEVVRITKRFSVKVLSVVERCRFRYHANPLLCSPFTEDTL